MQRAHFVKKKRFLMSNLWERYVPGTMIGEGRNALFLALREQERRQGWRYAFAVWLDDDVDWAYGGLASSLLCSCFGVF